MPSTTPLIKINAVQSRGSEVVLHGESLYEAYNYALEIQKKESLIFIHPFDDPLVMAGQGTIGLEIMEDLPELTDIILSIGGGGLAGSKAGKPTLFVSGKLR